MQGASSRAELGDLAPAREPVGDDRRLGAARAPPAGARARRTPARRRSARASKPNAPAMPQQPVSSASTSRPIVVEQIFSRARCRRSRAVWQWPCTSTPAGRARAADSRRRARRGTRRGGRSASRAASRPRRRGAGWSARRGRRRRSSAPGRRPARPRGSRRAARRGSRCEAAPWPCRACRSRRAAGRSRARRRGTSTAKPAASSTSTAACAVSGWKWLLKVSGQRITARPAALRAGRPREPVAGTSSGRSGGMLALRRDAAEPPSRSRAARASA